MITPPGFHNQKKEDRSAKLPRSFSTFMKLVICLFGFVGMFYLYIDKQNDLIELRMNVRTLTKELREIQENNISLQYEVDRFESPVHLMELAKKPAFSHLKYPYTRDILILHSAKGGHESD